MISPFRRQNPHTEKIKKIMAFAYNIGIQIKRKELTKTFNEDFKLKYWSPWLLQKYFSVIRVYP